MKQFYALFLWLPVISVNAQQFHLDSFPVWTENFGYVYNGYPGCVVTIQFKDVYFISGDSLIDTIYYKKLNHKGYKETQPWSGTGCPPYEKLYYNEGCIGIVREVNDLLLVKLNDDTIERKVYDMNFQVGDTIWVEARYGSSWRNVPLHIIADDSVNTTVGYKRMWRYIPLDSLVIWAYQDSNTTYPDAIIENIGYAFGLLHVVNYDQPWAEYSLCCYAENGNLVYEDGFEPSDCYMSLQNENIVGKELSFSIWPNPASDLLRYEIQGDIQPGQTKISLADVYGREVYREILPVQKGIPYTLPVGGLPPGMYVMQVESVNKTIARQKVMVQR